MSDFFDNSDVIMPEGIPKINFYKKPEYFEIAVPLFERCNLNCSFCFESHKDTTINYDKILMMPKDIIDQSKSDIIKSGAKLILLRLWGGELFFDALPDKIFDIYRKFIENFTDEVNKKLNGIKVDISFLSNGVFTKYDRVDKLLNDTNSVIAFSYDPSGRFSKESQKELWYKTLLHFKDKTKYISITLTKDSINAFTRNDEYFNKIPEDICIDINYYTANPNWQKHMPNDEDIYNFFKWCIDNRKYNVKVVNNLIRYKIKAEKQYIERYCDCKYAVQYSDGKCIKDCAKRASTLNREMFYEKYTNEVNDDNVTEVKNSMGLLKRGCFNCEYYDYCMMPCWVSLIFKEYKTDICPLYKIHKYISKETVSDFIDWREINDKDWIAIQNRRHV